jgi:two-component system response regulator (stage 0 sporulation protein F)
MSELSSKGTILVIEDDLEFQQTVKNFLECSGYGVCAFSDAMKALEFFAENPVDVVVTDLMLPGKDGLEAMLDILESRPQTTVIAMSGAATGNPRWLPCAELLGARRTFEKPFQLSDLVSEIDEIITKAS